jgi:hypothetical protein
MSGATARSGKTAYRNWQNSLDRRNRSRTALPADGMPRAWITGQTRRRERCRASNTVCPTWLTSASPLLRDPPVEGSSECKEDGDECNGTEECRRSGLEQTLPSARLWGTHSHRRGPGGASVDFPGNHHVFLSQPTRSEGAGPTKPCTRPNRRRATPWCGAGRR